MSASLALLDNPREAEAELRRRFQPQAPDPALRAGGGGGCQVELAAVMIDAGQLEPAGRLLQGVIQPGAALAFERGRLAEAAGRFEAALLQYREATRHEPRHAASRLATARLLARLGRAAEAEAAFAALLKREPGSAPALADYAWFLGSRHRYREALAIYDRLEAGGADMLREIAMLALGFAHVCDWSARATLREHLRARFASERPGVADAYALFCLDDDPVMHRSMAVCIAGAIARHSAGMARPASREVRREGRLKIGYLCGDLNQHATSLPLAGVIEAHDRERFEIVAYDYSGEDGSEIRGRTKLAFERFESLGAETPAQSAARIAADGIDILVDLNGYTERTRSEILALRPAPIQVNFLGYVGTQAGGWTDYVIADRHVLPASELANWSEQPVWMPASCYPGDRFRPLPPAQGERASYGLPADGFVFGCFNNPFKLSPEFFTIWMRLLLGVPGSVLWLYEGNALMAANLRLEAAAAGVDPARLVFAPAATLDVHIARHACLDLFLDTSPYGAHTTGADALWAGVPMVAFCGRAFPARVGASLLHAVGLPELIAESLEAYEALALSLASDPARRARLRAHLVAARQESRLFDASAFARALERGYLAMAERGRAGLAPAPIDLAGEPA